MTGFLSPTVKTLLLIAFAGLLLAGFGAGLLRDFASKDRAVLGGTVTSVTADGTDYKSPTPRLTRLDIRLDDGREVFVSSGNTLLRGLDAGARVRVAERVTPWGQTWYALVDPKPPAAETDPTPVRR